MTGHPGTDLNSKLPLNARTARIASGGDLAACSHRRPEKVKVSGESGSGTPEGLDAVERRTGEPGPARSRC